MTEKWFDNDKVIEAGVIFERADDGLFPGEKVVTLKTCDRQLVAIFPASSINASAGTVKGVIVGMRGDSYLVALPSHTVTSGSVACFPKKSIAPAAATEPHG